MHSGVDVLALWRTFSLTFFHLHVGHLPSLSGLQDEDVYLMSLRVPPCSSVRCIRVLVESVSLGKPPKTHLCLQLPCDWTMKLGGSVRFVCPAQVSVRDQYSS